jgi:hypothetical protein
MPSKLNTEFNYRYQVEGNTPWEKIKQLLNFLDGRKEAAAYEKVGEMKRKALILKLEKLKKTNAEEYLILEAEAELLEAEASDIRLGNGFDLNKQEIAILEKILAELYAIVEPTRLKHPDGTPFTDEEMFEVNAANEFTAMIGKEIYCEIVANGRPSPARVRNAMSNPHTLLALKTAGLLPQEMQYIEGSIDPLQIELKQTFFDNLKLSKTESLKIE